MFYIKPLSLYSRDLFAQPSINRYIYSYYVAFIQLELIEVTCNHLHIALTRFVTIACKVMVFYITYNRNAQSHGITILQDLNFYKNY